MLSELSDYPGDVNESMRHAGIILVVGIDYSNYDTKTVHYTYTVNRVHGTEYKIVTSQYFNSTTRVSTDRHGVKLFFMFSGTIVDFSFQVLVCCFAVYFKSYVVVPSLSTS